MATITPATAAFVEALNTAFGDRYTFEGRAGRTYDKVVQHFGEPRPFGGSVHAFVVRDTGVVLKAASWSAPAKGARGCVATAEQLAELMCVADPHGGYLCTTLS